MKITEEEKEKQTGLTFSESKQAITLPLLTSTCEGGWANLHSCSDRVHFPRWYSRQTSSVNQRESLTFAIDVNNGIFVAAWTCTAVVGEPPVEDGEEPVKGDIYCGWCILFNDDDDDDGWWVPCESMAVVAKLKDMYQVHCLSDLYVWFWH